LATLFANSCPPTFAAKLELELPLEEVSRQDPQAIDQFAALLPAQSLDFLCQMARSLREAGFRFEQLEQFYMPSQPKWVGYTYWGIASPEPEGGSQAG